MTKRSVAAVFLFALHGLFGPLQSIAAAAPEVVQAHPALWRVDGKHGTVYILGSIHLLPLNVNWHSPDVNRAMKRADVFVFEVAIDSNTDNRVRQLIDTQGTLPPGQSLRGLLPPASQADYDKALAYLGLPLQAVDDKRPWLAKLMMYASVLFKHHQLTDTGVDKLVTGEAMALGKEVRTLETVDQQIELIKPSNPDVELQSFVMELHTIETEDAYVVSMTRAWEMGDAATIGEITDAIFAGYPEQRATLLTVRNQAWLKTIEAMLNEHKTFFVTVGASHLVGDDGLPALLRAAGYKVDGP